MQGIGGMGGGLNRGASMSGNKGGTDSGTHGLKLLRSGLLTTISATFTAPSAGLYEVAIYGGGANYLSGAGQAPGGFAMRRVRLRKDEIIPYTIAPFDGAGTPSTVTFSDRVMTALSATGNTPVGGTGGDVNLAGSGSTAPSYEGYFGGATGQTPGGGATLGNAPAPGQIIITKVGD